MAFDRVLDRAPDAHLGSLVEDDVRVGDRVREAVRVADVALVQARFRGGCSVVPEERSS